MNVKFILQLTVAVIIAVWLSKKFQGDKRKLARQTRSFTQFPQYSRVWLPGLSVAKTEPGSQQPQSMLYTQ